MMHQLNIQFFSDWAVTSGTGAGAYADILTVKDVNRLPYVPGKTLKGMLRDAFEQGSCFGWFAEKSAVKEIIFGQEGANEGALQISSGELSDSEQIHFRSNPEHIQILYRTIHSTRISPETGSAEKGSLRVMEVVVPLNLSAEISFNQQLLSNAKCSEQEVLSMLHKVLPLITELGAKRTRGFGQVTMTLSAQGGQ